MAAYDLGKLAGDWQEVAFLAASGVPPCHPGTLRVEPGGGSFRLTGRLCLDGRSRQIATTATPSGPGRLSVAGFAEPWWLLWADDGARTAVLAAPSGAFAIVLDRGRIGADRLRAAREVLDFNGYDTGVLRSISGAP